MAIEIKLESHYHESRQEDITDAFMRGTIAGINVINNEVKRLETENAKLRELVCWMYDRMDESCAAQYPYEPSPISYDRLMQARARARKIGVEVDDGA